MSRYSEKVVLGESTQSRPARRPSHGNVCCSMQIGAPSRPAPAHAHSTSHHGRETREGRIPRIVTQGRPGVLPLTNKPDHTHTRTRTHSPPTDRAPARVLLAFRPRACLPPDSSRAALVNGPRKRPSTMAGPTPCAFGARPPSYDHLFSAPTSTRPRARAQEHAPRSTRLTSTRPGARARRVHSPARAGEGLARMLVVLLAQRAHRLELLPVR